MRIGRTSHITREYTLEFCEPGPALRSEARATLFSGERWWQSYHLRMRTCALLFIALAAGAQDRDISRGVNFFSLETEEKVGAQLAQTVLKRSTPTAHENAREYVERLGDRIGSALPPSPIMYKFTVIVEDSPDVHGTHEPMMLPGGYIIVSEHLILAAKDEAELAGMLAHSMVHVAGRHVTRMMTRKEIGQLGTYTGAPLVRMTEPDPIFAQEFEREADLISARAIAELGFSPASFAEYIRRTQVDEEHPSRSAMPTRQVRTKLIEAVVAKPPVRPSESSDEFFAIQRELR